MFDFFKKYLRSYAIMEEIVNRDQKAGIFKYITFKIMYEYYTKINIFYH